MPTPQLGSLNPNATLDELKDYLIGLNRYLNYLLSSLDTLNISRLDAKVIIADTITAEKLDVSELSAISANLGTITAGIIYGAYIATANGIYPRIELSSVGNLLSAFFDATHSLNVIPSLGGTPGLNFVSPGSFGNIIKGAFFTMASDVDILIQSQTNVRVSAGSSGSGKFNMDSPGGVVINGVSSLSGTKTYYVSDTSGGATNRKLTFTDGVLTSET